MSCEMSTRDFRHAMHMLVGFVSIRRPHSQHKLEPKKKISLTHRSREWNGDSHFHARAMMLAHVDVGIHGGESSAIDKVLEGHEARDGVRIATDGLDSRSMCCRRCLRLESESVAHLRLSRCIVYSTNSQASLAFMIQSS